MARTSGGPPLPCSTAVLDRRMIAPGASRSAIDRYPPPGRAMAVRPGMSPRPRSPRLAIRPAAPRPSARLASASRAGGATRVPLLLCGGREADGVSLWTSILLGPPPTRSDDKARTFASGRRRVPGGPAPGSVRSAGGCRWSGRHPPLRESASPLHTLDDRVCLCTSGEPRRARIRGNPGRSCVPQHTSTLIADFVCLRTSRPTPRRHGVPSRRRTSRLAPTSCRPSGPRPRPPALLPSGRLAARGLRREDTGRALPMMNGPRRAPTWARPGALDRSASS